MLISKKWLQSYFVDELPSMQKIADTLLLHSFEIEGLEEVNNDWILDIDVLPNRAHDCLSHQGIAFEIAGLLDLELKNERYSDFRSLQTLDEKISVNIENKEQCKRYIGTLVKNIEVRESPDWLKNRLRSMGQKSINALVDATNFIMFDIGQPMHVFDADKISGGIVIRNAKEGEKMITLSGEEIELFENDLVICDEEKILALAGVKGGSAAEVDENTKNIIIESANFNPLTTRKTARRVKILTDASKRYENEISSEKVQFANSALLSLIMELATTANTEIGIITDVYPNPEIHHHIEFTQKQLTQLLGLEISIDDINKILKRFNYSYILDGDTYTLIVPLDRLDLRIPEDIIEEIGRIYGYHNIPAQSLDEYHFKPQINKKFYVIQKIRNYFIDNGFTEIMNYSFVKKGNVELLNPIASDKKSLRKNLSQQMKMSIEKNAKLADFVNVDHILNFEIDIVHTKNGEELVSCFGIDSLSKKSRKQYGDENKQIEKYTAEIANLFGLEKINFEREGNVVSFNIEQCTQKTDDSYADILSEKSYPLSATFTGISIYPYIKRDISFWTTESDVSIFENTIKNADAKFLKKVFLFDEFEKEGRTSFAFSMIFQSDDKTLTDSEVDADMDKINLAVEKFGGEIR